jgi:hypothetical protein
MLEEKDLKFASQQQQEGIGAGAGFGKVGGGVTAVKKKPRSGCIGYSKSYNKMPNLRMEFVRIRNE